MELLSKFEINLEFPNSVSLILEDKKFRFIEKDKIVASWCGRFDDINKTHERLELIIEWYKAWTIVENNISLFIQHMIAKRKQKYLVPKPVSYTHLTLPTSDLV